ncbi:MAG: Uma2 family endonuclease [Chitinophagaceae bacterium]|nr:Uma2 family endonuclease [Anaerolineae bacterium]
MAASPNKKWTVEEYLSFERASEEKHEYLAGEIYLMTGASRKHNIIGVNVTTILNIQLRGRHCEAYANDMRVRVSVKNYTYPDFTVVCGTPEFEDAEVDTLLNPTVIIEVLSPSTEQYDRSKKFQNYRTLNSLQEYVLIAQDTPRIERYLRQENGQWLFSDTTLLEAAIELSSIGCSLPLAEVYDKVSFDTEPNL